MKGRLTDAVAILKKGIIENQADKDADSASLQSGDTGTDTRGAEQKPAEAYATALNAAASRDEGILYRVRADLSSGQAGTASANDRWSPWANAWKTEPQIYAKLILGEAQLKKGNAREAMNIFSGSAKTWRYVAWAF